MAINLDDAKIIVKSTIITLKNSEFKNENKIYFDSLQMIMNRLDELERENAKLLSEKILDNARNNLDKK